MQWGILGPGSVESTRRVRTLGLASSIRQFNELAVPGLGGVWFGRQLYLATLGVLIAERAEARGYRATPITVANAIEALACWLALDRKQLSDGRLRGTSKLANAGQEDLSFSNVSRPSFYVTQPMRMATVTALPALGLVKTMGSRFNSFKCSDIGLALVEVIGRNHKPYNHDLVEHLVQWVLGLENRMSTLAMHEALSPLLPLPREARILLEEVLRQGAPDSRDWERQRRSDALCWVQTRRYRALPCSWDQRPAQISAPDHWSDLQAGAAFFKTRDAALNVLDEMELQIETPDCWHELGSTLSQRLADRISLLRDRAGTFLKLGHGDVSANTFCREVLVTDDEVLRRLVYRDGRILRLVGDQIGAGPAFQGGIASNEIPALDLDESPPVDDLAWPESISYRIRNLWWLSLDLEGQLDAWLHPDSKEVSYG